MQFQGTMFFEGIHAEGWTESHYFNATDAPTALTSLATVVTARLALLPTACFVVRTRLSLLPFNRTVQLGSDVAQAGTNSTPEPYLLDSACDIVLEALAGRYSVRKYIRPVLVGQIGTDGRTLLSGYVGLLNTYISVLLAETVLRVKGKAPDPVGVTLIVAPSAGLPGVYLNRKTGRPFGLPRGRLNRPS
jgi:hypothetical protein